MELVSRWLDSQARSARARYREAGSRLADQSTVRRKVIDALAILQRLAAGNLIEELANALVVTAEEVVATGKPGTVTLTLKVSTRAQLDPMVVVEEQIARSAPKKDAKAAFFFAIDGDLHRDDPRQTRINFREIDRETGEIRDTRNDQDMREVSS